LGNSLNKRKDTNKTEHKLSIEQINLNKNIITKYLSNLNNYSISSEVVPKDVVILLDVSESMLIKDNKKVDNALKNIINIYDNYIVDNDRFSLFTYDESINQVIPLCYKSKVTYSYVKNQIEDLYTDLKITVINSNDAVINEEEKEVNRLTFSKAVLKVYDFLRKKSK